jgi:hypothetical protein
MFAVVVIVALAGAGFLVHRWLTAEVPTIWIVNFALLYVLKPSLAAQMPKRWAPIPARVVYALDASPTGQVRYSKYASQLP